MVQLNDCKNKNKLKTKGHARVNQLVDCRAYIQHRVTRKARDRDPPWAYNLFFR